MQLNGSLLVLARTLLLLPLLPQKYSRHGSSWSLKRVTTGDTSGVVSVVPACTRKHPTTPTYVVLCAYTPVSLGATPDRAPVFCELLQSRTKLLFLLYMFT